MIFIKTTEKFKFINDQLIFFFSVITSSLSMMSVNRHQHQEVFVTSTSYITVYSNMLYTFLKSSNNLYLYKFSMLLNRRRVCVCVLHSVVNCLRAPLSLSAIWPIKREETLLDHMILPIRDGKPPPPHLLVEVRLFLKIKLHHSVVVVDTVAMEMIHLSCGHRESLVAHCVCVCYPALCSSYCWVVSYSECMCVTLQCVAHTAESLFHTQFLCVVDFSSTN